MALIDESRAAFRELRAVMPATIEFNGIEKTGVSHSITLKRIQEMQGYSVNSSCAFELEDTDFAAFVTMGLKDRVSKMKVTTGTGETEEFIFMNKDTHPCSATVYLFLGGAK